MSRSWMDEFVGRIKDDSPDVERTEMVHDYIKRNMTIDEYRGYCKGQMLIGLIEMAKEKIDI